MDRATALKQVIAIAADVWKAEFSQITVRAWMAVLEPYEPEDIQAALMAHMSDPKKGEFAPKPASLIAQIEKKNEVSTDVFRLLKLATQRVTARTGVAFPDKAIHAAMAALGGWPAAYAKLTKAEDTPEYINDFAKAYTRAKATPLQHPAFLPGVTNEARFYPVGDDLAAVDLVVDTGYDPLPQRQLAAH